MVATRLKWAAIGLVLGPAIFSVLFLPLIFVDWGYNNFTLPMIVYCVGCIGAGVVGGTVGFHLAAKWAHGSEAYAVRIQLRSLFLATTIVGVLLGLAQLWGPASVVFFLFIAAAVLRASPHRRSWRKSAASGAVAGLIVLGALGPMIRFLPHPDGYIHQAAHFFWLIFDLPTYALCGFVGGGVIGTAVWAGSYALLTPFEFSARRTIAGICACVCMCIVVTPSLFAAGLPSELVEAALMQTDTIYADDYTHFRWKLIHVGMTPIEVTTSIGQPVDKWSRQDRGEFWSYSCSPGDTHHFSRILLFRDDKLVQVDSSLYFD